MEYCTNCNGVLVEDNHNGIVVCTSCGLCSKSMCLVPDYIPEFELFCDDSFMQIGKLLNLSDQFVTECSEVFQTLNNIINWRGRTLKCVRGAIVFVIAPKYGNFLGIEEVCYVSECTKEQLKSAIHYIKTFVNVEFSYTEALHKIAKEFKIDFHLFKNFL